MTVTEITNAFKNNNVIENRTTQTLSETGYRAVLALTTALNNGWVIVREEEVKSNE